ncbi:MAG: propionate catabolism operon regulatory protein PrpR [Betaproteobacteria bacterium]|nr:propionate catabolism operon regulatory protein PrpR [Betaproteobacteria bacterium]
MGFGMIGMLPALMPDYGARAEIRAVNKIFEDALEAAKELVQRGQVHAFVAGGANGAFLRQHLRVPVVLIRVTGFDILHALAKAREVSDRIAIFSYEAISSELEEVKQLLKLDIEQCFYTTPEDAQQRVAELARAGFKVIVGSSMIKRLAEEAGLAGVFLYSENSMRQALDDALEIARLAVMEETRREWLNGILQHLDDAVVAVDLDSRVQAMNPAMEKLLSVSAEWSLGRRLSEIAPELDLESVLRTGDPELQQIQRVGSKTLVTNRIAIREHGLQTGAVLTCQDARVIQRADRNIRSQGRGRSFVARYRLSQISGKSPAILHTRSLAEKYAATDATILITGESGTGKELLAQGIHNASRRRAEPFVAINCGAFPESLLESELFGYEEGAFTGSRRGGKTGLVETAHQGTLFLDEIAEMPVPLQTRLLRVLQEKEVLRLGSNEPTPVEVRVIAATHRNLREWVSEGRFREDLYYRLNILHLHIPPLRERGDDLEEIAGRLLAEALRRHRATLAPEPLLASLMPLFESHPWPGNVRELENVIERVAIYCSTIGEDEILELEQLRNIMPELIGEETGGGVAPAGNGLRSMGRSAELAHIRRTVEECGGNLGEASRRLGISRTTLWRRLNTRN